MLRRFASLAYCAVAAVLMTGCAAPVPPANVPPPDIHLSPVYDLLLDETVRDKVNIVFDGDGRAHVLIESTRRKEIHHVVVAPEGVVERDVVHSAVSPRVINSVFNERGIWHALLDCDQQGRS